jgi:predicted RNA-binding protein associated with RNAse of E/G family
LKKCKELGIDRVMMDCDKSNIASAKSIMNNSGILENEVMIDGELNQRYWISLKKRYANRYEFQKNTIYKIKSINSDEFTGDVCYYKFKSINRKINISNGTCILDNNYEWLEFYDYNSKIKLSALYNNKKEIIEWYFDIAREIGNENGCPYEDDLYLDVVVNPNGEILLLDEDELKEAFDRLEVSQETYDMAYNEANNLMEKLKGNKDKLEKFTNRYLKDLEVII